MSYKLQKIRSSNGFSLIELMISVALGVALLAGVIQIFDSNKQSSRLQHAFVEVQEAGRIAADLLSRDIRMADYWGCTDTDNILDHLNHDDPHYDEVEDIEGAVGLNARIAAANEAEIGGRKPLLNTNILTLRGSRSASDVRVQEPVMPSNAAVIHLAPTTTTDIDQWEVVLITDCTGGDRFSNSNDLSGASTSNASTLNLGHAASGNTGHDGIQNATKINSRAYDASAQILLPFSVTYFIAENDNATNSLYRLNGGPDGELEELVRNIDDMQFIFAEDTNDNQSVNRFNPVADVLSFDDVLSIRTTFSVSSSELINGQAFSRNYTFTTNIRNRSI